MAHAHFQPGCRWSEHVGDPPSEGHSGYVLSGRMMVQGDGAEALVQEGQTYHIAPGVDAWVDGSLPCDVLDWTGMSDYIRVASS